MVGAFVARVHTDHWLTVGVCLPADIKYVLLAVKFQL